MRLTKAPAMPPPGRTVMRSASGTTGTSRSWSSSWPIRCQRIHSDTGRRAFSCRNSATTLTAPPGGGDVAHRLRADDADHFRHTGAVGEHGVGPRWVRNAAGSRSPCSVTCSGASVAKALTMVRVVAVSQFRRQRRPGAYGQVLGEAESDLAGVSEGAGCPSPPGTEP